MKRVANLKYILFEVTRRYFGAVLYGLFCFQNTSHRCFMIYEPDPDGGMTIMSYQRIAELREDRNRRAKAKQPR